MSTATQAVGSSRRKDWPKHAFIAAVLAIELLPLYMMCVIASILWTENRVIHEVRGAHRPEPNGRRWV